MEILTAHFFVEDTGIGREHVRQGQKIVLVTAGSVKEQEDGRVRRRRPEEVNEPEVGVLTAVRRRRPVPAA